MNHCHYNCFRPSTQGPIPGPEFFFNMRDNDVEENIQYSSVLPTLVQVPGPTFRINRGDTLNFRGG